MKYLVVLFILILSSCNNEVEKKCKCDKHEFANSSHEEVVDQKSEKTENVVSEDESVEMTLVTIPTLEYVKGEPIVSCLSVNTANAHVFYSGGVPFMEMNPFFLINYPIEVQYFVFYHEIGHFKLGHLEDEYVEHPLLDELEADYYSLHFLFLDGRYDFGPAEYFSIIKYASDYHIDEKIRMTLINLSCVAFSVLHHFKLLYLLFDSCYF